MTFNANIYNVMWKLPLFTHLIVTFKANVYGIGKHLSGRLMLICRSLSRPRGFSHVLLAAHTVPMSVHDDRARDFYPRDTDTDTTELVSSWFRLVSVILDAKTVSLACSLLYRKNGRA